MNWNERIFRYCERGSDPSFWAEPLNAVSNAAFVLAALAAAIELSRRPAGERGFMQCLLIALVFIIGIGSFLFHTYATVWAAQADVVPIGVFMLVYFAFALRMFLGLPWVATGAGVALFVAALDASRDIQCRPGLLGLTDAAHGPCLNGTAAYAPAFLAMVLIGLTLLAIRHRAAPLLLMAATVFLASMFFRTVDLELCNFARFGGTRIGTHALWHILNALTLYLLLAAAIRHGRKESRVSPVATTA